MTHTYLKENKPQIKLSLSHKIKVHLITLLNTESSKLASIKSWRA